MHRRVRCWLNPEVLAVQNNVCSYSRSRHRNAIAGLLLVTLCGHSGSPTSSPTKQQNFDDNVYLGDLRVKRRKLGFLLCRVSSGLKTVPDLAATPSKNPCNAGAIHTRHPNAAAGLPSLTHFGPGFTGRNACKSSSAQAASASPLL